MVTENQVEATIKEVFSEFGLKWKVFWIQDNKPSGTWDIRIKIPESDPVDFSVNKGTLAKVKESVRGHVRYRLERLVSN